MESIVNYPDRGPDGRNTYRGNCSGYLIEDLIRQFNVKNLCDYMVGSGTSEDVAARMGISGQFYDLNRGFDLLNMDIPERSEFTFWHPPYGTMIKYAGEQYSAEDVQKKYGFDPREHDLSREQTWEDFVTEMNYCCVKQFAALEKGGHMAVLMGDMKKKGKCYSMLTDIAKPGTLINIVIKTQNNCVSSGTNYTGKSFIPILHEYLMIVRKDSNLYIPIQMSRTHNMDVRDMNVSTWRDVVYAVIESLGGSANLSDIYSAIEGHKKAQENAHWQEKVRQTVQINNIFESPARGVWKISNPKRAA